MSGRLLFGLALLIIVVGAGFWRRSAPPLPMPNASADAGRSGGKSKDAVHQQLAESKAPLSAAPTWSGSPPAAGFGGIADRLDAASDPGESRRILGELRAILDGLPREVAAREVTGFLGLKRDAATKLDVTVKAGGMLGDASSLRVFLLDYLGQIDRPAAAAIGRQILSAPTSADEWAVSMRNVAWADSSAATQIYLRAKVGEMIATPVWRQNPSAGFLEAFDVIVHARAVNLAPQLTALVRDKDNRAVAHAAYLTLDRLTLADPAAALAPLAAEPEMMTGREQTRANFFARADVSDPPQRTLLEGYLLDPRRSAEELQTFAGIFPNANYMISNNLLTTTNTPAHAELVARDRAALGVVEGWMIDERFTRMRPQLETIRSRLQTFVQQADTSSPK